MTTPKCNWAGKANIHWSQYMFLTKESSIYLLLPTYHHLSSAEMLVSSFTSNTVHPPQNRLDEAVMM